MKIISIIYHSGSGHTTEMAKAVANGAASVEEIKVNLLATKGNQIVDGRWQDEVVMEQLNSSDAIIFGSPTYMGSVSAQFKAFTDATSAIYFSRQWKDKLAAGFTVSGSPSGDKMNTLMTMFILAAQQGMIWVGLGETPLNDNGVNRLGGYVAGTLRDKSQMSEFEALAPGRALALEVDITNPEQVKAGVEKAIATFGQIDVLANNAGHGLVGAIQTIQEKIERLQQDVRAWQEISTSTGF